MGRLSWWMLSAFWLASYTDGAVRHRPLPTGRQQLTVPPLNWVRSRLRKHVGSSERLFFYQLSARSDLLNVFNCSGVNPVGKGAAPVTALVKVTHAGGCHEQGPFTAWSEECAAQHLMLGQPQDAYIILITDCRQCIQLRQLLFRKRLVRVLAV